ncbi:uncharacterized protein N7511_007597, partial [Penicillium nucicola]|uniref:uncharacterized protein n=1 Tax=Penicillium nucicola TaxID=1850975 RepID=UPI0025450710
MVYGGKPSTGCYLCRKRKIKCDEAHPECRNCIIYRRPCPGYRPDAVFRNETKKVERLVKNGNHASASNSSNNSNSESNSGTQAHTPDSESSVIVAGRRRPGNIQSNPTLTLYSPADSNWEQRALCYFFDQFTIKADGEDGGHLDYLPPLYAREIGQGGRTPSSCLRWAVDATALMTLANAKNAPPLMNKARLGYGKALRSLQEALASPTDAVKDETFASVVLLSLYEDISGERNGLFSSHTAGFEFLMKLRGEGQMDHRRGRDMFNFAYTHLYVEILALGDKPRFDIDWVVTMLDSTNPVERLMITASSISQVFISMRSAPPTDQATVEGWIAAGLEHDAELAQWTETLPDHWLPLFVYSDQGEPLMTYKRISNAVVWNYYRAARVMLQQLLVSLHGSLATIKLQSCASESSFTHPGASTPETIHRTTIRELTTEVCRSIPFCLSDVDSLGRPATNTVGEWQMRAAQGYGLLWPLWYVLSCGMPTPAQVEQIRTVLYRIGSEHGIKLALVLAREAERIRGEHAEVPVP